MALSLAAPVRVTVAGHELVIFVESPPMIEAALEDIRSAQTRVWLETYIFADDTVGRTVAAALKERARAGVSVRVLYDPIGSRSTPTAFFRDLEQAGVQVMAFNSPWQGWWRLALLRVL